MPEISEFFDDWQEIIRELESQTDRGAAIVGAALLESRLEKVLLTICVPELSDLSEKLFSALTFRRRVELCRALGFIGEKSAADLKLIGKIRNRFAHRLAFRSFDDVPVRDWCARLALADFVFASQEPPSNPRERFISAVVNAARFMHAELVAGTGVGQQPDKSP